MRFCRFHPVERLFLPLGPVLTVTFPSLFAFQAVLSVYEKLSAKTLQLNPPAQGMPKKMLFSEVATVRQSLCSAAIKDIPAAVRAAIHAFPIRARTRPGESVAVAVGSRGISHIDRIVKECIDFFKKKGFHPFIVPAMGSHGGATADGQGAVLESLGVTEAAMGVELVCDMEVEHIGTLSNDMGLFLSKKALEADHIVLINRVKPHTKFKADIESGLCKMLTIGLGKAVGAAEFHRRAVKHSFRIIEEAAGIILKNCRLLFGLALLEDGRGETAAIETVAPELLISREKVLLKQAGAMMGKIPFERVDILVLDFIGKEISGIGMDSNVTGRHRDLVGDFYGPPHVKRIFVRDLSPNSGGNGNGIGLADFTTKRLVDSLDLKKTYVNAITAISPEKAAIPMYFETDREALEACVRTIGLASAEDVRMVRIRDTRNLELLQVSRAFEPDLQSDPRLEVLTPWRPIRFDDGGNLFDWNFWDGY